ncbi:CheR family methyltransferase [Pseudomonas aeruginosa]
MIDTEIKPIAKDLVFTDQDLQRVIAMIYARAGIVLDNSKREMVYSRLAKRLRLHGMKSFTDYLNRLDSSPSAKEWVSFTNALTTNLTAFFREGHHFPLLAKHIANRIDPIRIWCAAASTGEEPYSIAITLAETLSSTQLAKAEIIATDIDTDAIGKCIAGTYSLTDALVSGVGEARLKRFFLKGGGDNNGFARVRPELMNLIQFKAMNLHAPNWDIKGPFDAIFCRNIMIYFDRESQARLLSRFAPLLKPDGLLITGHSENFNDLTTDFKLRGQTVYTLSPSGRGRT